MSHKEHWLRSNAANRTPRRLICFDSEAVRTLNGKVEQHSFRLACASFDVLDECGELTKPTEYVTFTTTEELWRWATGKTNTTHRTWMVAHNLSYDLRLTESLSILPSLGYDVRQIALNDYSCWARFALHKRSLLLSDSRSWLTMPLDIVARMLKIRRVKLPLNDDPIEKWEARCANDVKVLRAAMLGIIRFVRDENLGDFRQTGHAQASAAYRHRFMAGRSILVHWDMPAREHERRAGWTGRAEVWRHGEYRESLVEWDFQAAYARVAQRENLPARLLGKVASPSLDRVLSRPPERRYLLNVEVETGRETVPTMHEGRIVWPVGRFQTTLWDDEVALALEHGATARISQAWIYEASPVLRDWATWILAALDGKPPGDDPLRRAILKGWSRSLIGRFALRYPMLQFVGEEEQQDTALFWVWDADKGKPVNHLQIGDRLYRETELQESESSAPAIMSCVMAHARIDLWRCMETAGFDNVMYVDTDSILVNLDGHRALDKATGAGFHPGLRVKGRYREAQLRATRNISLDGSARVAGLPLSGRIRTDGGVDAEVWESLPVSLRRRRPSGCYVLQRSFLLSDEDHRRTRCDDGLTSPIRIG